MRLSRLLTPLVALSLACGTSYDSTTAPSFKDTGVVETTTFVPAFGIDITSAGWVKTSTGLYYRTLNAGADTAKVVANGQKVAVNYIGWLVNGQSFDSGQYSFTLGGTGVIAGWNVGIVGMKIGEIRRLLIPASLGYGATGSGPIPPNATLVFDVQVASAT
jgi:FKBP-type peptidyl-prolyl cis-trans isomerase